MLISKVDLNGKWNLICNAKNINIVGDVPASNFTMLLKAGVIDDPFVSTNEQKVKWVGENDWQFSGEFELSSEVINSKHITLECLQLDTICKVLINGKVVGEADNCFIPHSFDIKNYVHEGKNTITIMFDSPVNYVKRKQAVEKVPRNNNGQSGIPHIRKPQCHFGWDWGPVLVGSGIMKDIFIKYSNYEDIDEFEVKQSHNDGKVLIKVNASTKNNEVTNFNVKILSPSGEELFSENKTSSNITSEFVVNNPELWWTYELSKKDKQPLYSVVVTITNEKGESESKVKKIGLRDIKLIREADEYGANFCFELNGVKIFSKGANLIPFDSFNDRVDNNVIDYYIDSARFSNFNLIRVWGGGYYADDYFYDKCDECGILVWQDFMFACQPYPFFEEKLLDNILNEITVNVKRIKHHASLAVFCGNNEIEVMEIAWKHRRKYCKWTEKFFYHILPNHLKTIDSDLIYIEGSPCGVGYNKGHSTDNVGDTHLWAVWHGLQPLEYYRKRMTRFCSEFGFESLPDLKSIEKFATKEDYSLSSKVFNSHQKCMSGNNKMKYYIASRFMLPDKFEDYIYLSQICQLECIKDATLNWRRNKGRCNGSLFWQLNDCWPVCSWSSIDYYGNYKALQYGAKHFFDSLIVSAVEKDNNVKLYLHNDTLTNKNVRVEANLIDFDGNILFTDDFTDTIGSNSVKLAKSYEISKLGNFDKLSSVFVFKLFDETNGSKLIDTITYLFDKEKNLILPKASANIDITLDNDDIVIELSSDKYLRYVSVYSKTNTSRLTDNFFDLLPNQKVVIRQKNTLNKSLEELREDYIISSLCDVVSTSTKLKDNLERLRIFMIPENFFQYIYYLHIPNDINVKK